MIRTTTQTLHETLGNKIFSIVYTTKTGRTIKRRGRFNVMRGCKNPPKINANYINYFDLEKNDFRNASLKNIQLIKQGKKLFVDCDFNENDLESKNFIITTKTAIFKEYRIKAKDADHALEIKSRLHSQAYKAVREVPEFVCNIEEEDI